MPLRDGVTDLDALVAALDDDVSAVVLQQPNFLGAVEDVAPLAAAAKQVGALVVCACDPLPLGILEPPGACGVDSRRRGPDARQPARLRRPVVRLLRRRAGAPAQMPGRIAGETQRRRRPPRLRADPADARAAHPPREGDLEHLHRAGAQRARGLLYLSWLGRRGLVELAELLLQRTAYARERLTALDGVEPLHEQPVVREFALRLDADVERVVERLPLRESMPATRSAATTRSMQTACSSR